MPLPRRHAAPAPSPAPAFTVRPAACDDERALRRLAERDSRPLPPAPLLVAERDGALLAALSLADGSAVADPFSPTADLVAVLRVRAAQLVRRPRRRLRRARGRRALDTRLAGGVA